MKFRELKTTHEIFYGSKPSDDMVANLKERGLLEYRDVGAIASRRVVHSLSLHPDNTDGSEMRGNAETTKEVLHFLEKLEKNM